MRSNASAAIGEVAWACTLWKRRRRCAQQKASATAPLFLPSVNRDAARQRGICPVIPSRANAADRPAFFPKALYRARARIEQTIGKLKRFKRIALRCEKTAENYASFIAFACGLILVKSVHTA